MSWGKYHSLTGGKCPGGKCPGGKCPVPGVGTGVILDFLVPYINTNRAKLRKVLSRDKLRVSYNTIQISFNWKLSSFQSKDAKPIRNIDYTFFTYSGVRVIASRILHEIFLLIGELHFMMSSYSKTNDLLQTAIHSIFDDLVGGNIFSTESLLYGYH